MSIEQFYIFSIIVQSITALLFAGVLGCAFFQLRPAVGQFRMMAESSESEKNTRYAELITHLANRWDSEILVRSRIAVRQAGKDLKSRILESEEKADYDTFIKLMTVANFFDTMGVLVEQGYMTGKAVKDVFGKAAEAYYALYKEIIETEKYKGYLTCYQCLIDKIKNIH